MYEGCGWGFGGVGVGADMLKSNSTAGELMERRQV